MKRFTFILIFTAIFLIFSYSPLSNSQTQEKYILDIFSQADCTTNPDYELAGTFIRADGATETFCIQTSQQYEPTETYLTNAYLSIGEMCTTKSHDYFTIYQNQERFNNNDPSPSYICKQFSSTPKKTEIIQDIKILPGDCPLGYITSQSFIDGNGIETKLCVKGKSEEVSPKQPEQAEKTTEEYCKQFTTKIECNSRSNNRCIAITHWETRDSQEPAPPAEIKPGCGIFPQTSPEPFEVLDNCVPKANCIPEEQRAPTSSFLSIKYNQQEILMPYQIEDTDVNFPEAIPGSVKSIINEDGCSYIVFSYQEAVEDENLEVDIPYWSDFSLLGGPRTTISPYYKVCVYESTPLPVFGFTPINIEEPRGCDWTLRNINSPIAWFCFKFIPDRTKVQYGKAISNSSECSQTQRERIGTLTLINEGSSEQTTPVEQYGVKYKKDSCGNYILQIDNTGLPIGENQQEVNQRAENWISECKEIAQPQQCGNGKIEGDEECDNGMLCCNILGECLAGYDCGEDSEGNPSQVCTQIPGGGSVSLIDGSVLPEEQQYNYCVRGGGNGCSRDCRCLVSKELDQLRLNEKLRINFDMFNKKYVKYEEEPNLNFEGYPTTTYNPSAETNQITCNLIIPYGYYPREGFDQQGFYIDYKEAEKLKVEYQLRVRSTDKCFEEETYDIGTTFFTPDRFTDEKRASMNNFLSHRQDLYFHWPLEGEDDFCKNCFNRKIEYPDRYSDQTASNTWSSEYRYYIKPDTQFSRGKFDCFNSYGTSEEAIEHLRPYEGGEVVTCYIDGIYRVYNRGIYHSKISKNLYEIGIQNVPKEVTCFAKVYLGDELYFESGSRGIGMEPLGGNAQFENTPPTLTILNPDEALNIIEMDSPYIKYKIEDSEEKLCNGGVNINLYRGRYSSSDEIPETAKIVEKRIGFGDFGKELSIDISFNGKTEEDFTIIAEDSGKEYLKYEDGRGICNTAQTLRTSAQTSLSISQEIIGEFLGKKVIKLPERNWIIRGRGGFSAFADIEYHAVTFIDVSDKTRLAETTVMPINWGGIMVAGELTINELLENMKKASTEGLIERDNVISEDQKEAIKEAVGNSFNNNNKKVVIRIGPDKIYFVKGINPSQDKSFTIIQQNRNKLFEQSGERETEKTSTAKKYLIQIGNREFSEDNQKEAKSYFDENKWILENQIRRVKTALN